MKKTLGICGAGGLGREVLELAKNINKKYNFWKSYVFIVDEYYGVDFVDGVKLFTYKDAIKQYSDDIEFSIAVGEPLIRKKIFQELKCDGAKCVTMIHPEVYIPESTVIGEGVTINMGCFISCNVEIKNNVYIQPHAHIGHDCILDEGCIISGIANIAGSCHIGEYSYLGISSCIKENITVGKYSIIGMASAIYRDVPDEIIMMGNPARPVQRNRDGHVFKKRK